MAWRRSPTDVWHVGPQPDGEDVETLVTVELSDREVSDIADIVEGAHMGYCLSSDKCDCHALAERFRSAIDDR